MSHLREPNSVDDKPMATEILPSTSMPLTLHYEPRTLRMHTLTETELETVASLSNSVHLTFLGMSFGSLVAFALVLWTIEIKDPTQHAILVGLTWISAVFSLYFGIRAAIDYRASRRKLKEIKAGA